MRQSLTVRLAPANLDRVTCTAARLGISLSAATNALIANSSTEKETDNDHED
ncbi:ribbon-helix-helix domain-containing protein [Arthrobacter tecti]